MPAVLALEHRRIRARRTGRALPRSSETDLVGRAARGDREALEALIGSHFPLALREARAWTRPGIPTDDLVSAACLGLIEAVSRFDAARGCRFMTYATWWIRRRVAEAARAYGRNVRIPRQRLAAGAVAFDPPREVPLAALGTRDEPIEPWGGASDPVACVLRLEREASLARALCALPARERMIVELRHGIGGADARTLEDLAGEIGVSKERVRQLEAQAMRRLRDRLSRLA